jgi:hypothetical protein
MAPAATVRLKGLPQLHRALKAVDGDLAKQLDHELKAAAELVAGQARMLFGHISARSAAGFRPRTRGFGRAVVAQSRRRTTGQRPDFGSLQMRRALLPALADKHDDVEHAIEHMLDVLGRPHGF